MTRRQQARTEDSDPALLRQVLKSDLIRVLRIFDIVSLVVINITKSDSDTPTSISKLFRDAQEVTAARAKLGRKYTYAGPITQLVNRVEHIHNIEAQRDRLHARVGRFEFVRKA
jgi:hypothetical protein